MRIFVSIASYRDPQLMPTVQDCLGKARHPERLRFGICWQHGPEEIPFPYSGDPRFRVLDVDWRESLGACWARAQIMRLWDGEEYFLQLDSHHRFAPDWDAKLLRDAERTGSPKPILTTYATPFTPGEDEVPEGEPMQMNFDRFTEEGIVLFRPGPIPGWQSATGPVRARFLSAHFLFTIGDFAGEVPYDPELYFIGEEITLAIRAFTHGYDLFHPAETILWHEYTRSYRTKHWDDHVKARGVEREWHERDAASKDKVKRFLASPDVGPLGCGSVRTFAEYEAYGGISFRHRRVQDYTRRGGEPPNPPAPADWAEKMRAYRVRICLDRAALPEPALADPHFWYVGVHDANREEIHRQDISAEELAALCSGNSREIVLNRDFESNRDPATWTVWPVSRSVGWLDKIDGSVDLAPPPATLVTALLDIGRGGLPGPFARPFREHYLTLFERLLAVGLPMVIYIDARHCDFVWRWRWSADTKVIPLRLEDLRAFPQFDRIQEIRSRPGWLQQADWLRSSPQAALEYYNPLVMSKMRWLAEQARENPFGSEHIFWVDANVCHTVDQGHLREPTAGRRLAGAAREFLFLGFPHREGAEIHGFPRDELARAAGVPSVDQVIRGGFFGGRADVVIEVASLYEDVLADTLAAGHMGTEESVFTILYHRHPDRFRCYMLKQDGLMSSFFDALRDGREGELLLHTPPPKPAWPPGIVGADPDGARTGATTFLGLHMLQNCNAVFAWQELTRHLAAAGVRVSRVVEIGTGPGGLSVLLKVYCLTQGAEFITYDRYDGANQSILFRRLQIELRVRDEAHEFSVAEIAREIQKAGVTVLVCDGSDKVREVITFVDYLKPGDFILAHDYAPSVEAFERDLKGVLWSWCEITDAQVRNVAERNVLEPVLPDVMTQAAWMCRVKRGTAVKRVRPDCRVARVGLYVLSFNSPGQFGMWLASVREADPTMLEGTEKVLLNNSTDTSTYPAYDELCRAHQVAQVRLNNVGIVGGRLWCAKHFDAETNLDAMLYFEDDMLLHSKNGLCANGFTTWVPNLFDRARDIAGHEDLDFLKLSFTELHGDHLQHWAYHNLPEVERDEYFPDGPRTRVHAIKSYRGLAYLLGDVFYSNWPMLITRRGNRTLFLGEDAFPPFEQVLMVRALKLARMGALRGAVLLASPVRHHREYHYAASERRES